jgi:hypothetical protein
VVNNWLARDPTDDRRPKFFTMRHPGTQATE